MSCSIMKGNIRRIIMSVIDSCIDKTTVDHDEAHTTETIMDWKTADHQKHQIMYQKNWFHLNMVY